MLFKQLVVVGFLLKLAVAIQLQAKSSHPEIDGLGISSKHTGAGTDYLYLGKDFENFAWNGNSLSKSVGSAYNQYFTVKDRNPQFSVSDKGSKLDFLPSRTGTLHHDDSPHGFYACKNTGDPYSYSKDNYQLQYYKDQKPPNGCLDLVIVGCYSNSTAPHGKGY
ncbi:hypothetical protein OGAPHI_004287 [Ogataea philodendri]|uniref:Secreted protein n=1 Tax=Ogataea philodendri TaxID=1378263 RepID=A0A9P8P5B0_9ASCO|nr:uncharacterized protein OGAPHI_004287 [Ogataea philodendri]KAH3666098.1 hypothetical protein OGAPHI_004287 [Ogataea philodendri]